MENHYSKTFFAKHKDGSARSAQEVVPHVLKLIQIKSVVDVGSGVGGWLRAFQEKGVEDILGIDGDWVDKKMLLIPSDRFINRDLTQPIKLDRKFDLAMTLEVGEHLDEKYAETFVKSLVDLAPIILFSAAVPMQGGEHHVNEQWPAYWADKFIKHDYVLIDCLRKKVWNNVNVGSWYAQNIFLIIKKDILQNYPILQTELEKMDPEMLSVINPRLFVAEMKKYEAFRKNYSTVRKILLPVWWIGKLAKKIFRK